MVRATDRLSVDERFEVEISESLHLPRSFASAKHFQGGRAGLAVMPTRHEQSNTCTSRLAANGTTSKIILTNN